MTNLLSDLLRRQYLIVGYINERILVVNYIVDGYHSDHPILRANRFLHYTAHVYYRSIAVDLFALFGPASGSNKNSFHFLYKEEYKDLQLHGHSEKVRQLLSHVEAEIAIVKNMRHQQIAHFDFDKNANISLSFGQLDKINTLCSIAEQLLSSTGLAQCEEMLRCEYDFTWSQADLVKSLDGLLKRK